MRGWMMVMACTLPFAALAQPEGDSAAAAPANATAGATPAAETTVAAPVKGTGFGSQTRYWLAIQTSGAESVTDERPMPGEAATMVYERYLKSFTHPIPERFESNSFKVSNSGTTGGGN